jgi:predicted DNA-binding transcriptional regulator AlpA
MPNNDDTNKKYFTTRQMCARYGDSTPRTIDRWVEVGILPKPLMLGGRNLFEKGEVEAAERAAMVAGPPFKKRPMNNAEKILASRKQNTA